MVVEQDTLSEIKELLGKGAPTTWESVALATSFLGSGILVGDKFVVPLSGVDTNVATSAFSSRMSDQFPETETIKGRYFRGNSDVGGLIFTNHPFVRRYLSASQIEIDLGSIPTTVDTAAADLLSSLPYEAVGAILRAIRSWIADHAEVRRARVTVESEPDDPDWQEVVFEIVVAVGTEEALRLWDEVGNYLDEAKSMLDAGGQEAIAEHLAIHLAWDEDDDETED